MSSEHKKFPSDVDIVTRIFRVYRDTLLPELVDVLGFEQTVKIMDIFGGKQIYIPSINEIKIVLRDYRIFKALHGLQFSQLDMVVSNLAETHGLSNAEILEIYSKEASIQYSPPVDMKDVAKDRPDILKRLSVLKKTIYSGAESGGVGYTRYKRVRREDS